MKIGVLVIFMNLKLLFGLNHTSKFILRKENYFNIFIDTTVTILQKCFLNKSGPTILVANWDESDLKYKNFHIPNVALVGFSSYRYINYFIKNRDIFKLELNEIFSKPFPANAFLFYETESRSLSFLFKELKKSIWWNAAGMFFLAADGKCSNARYFLKIAINFNVINAVYICSPSKFHIDLYTLNPYDKSAPDGWEFTDIQSEGNGYLSSLFKQSYKRILSTARQCTDLFFEKIVKLKTYPLILCVTPLPMIAPVDPQSPFKISGISVKVLKGIIDKLEAKIVIKMNESRGIIDDHGKAHDLLADILHGRCDMGMNIEYSRNLWRNEINTFQTSGLCIVTRKEEITIEEHIARTVTPQLLLFLFLIFGISTGSFIYFFKQSWSKIILDEIRMIVAVSVIYKPRRRSERILFAWFIVVFMGFSSYLLSQLNALLTVASYRPVVNGKEDLVNSQHDIYTDVYMNQFLDDPRMVPRLRDRGTLIECLEKLKVSKNVACLEDCLVIKFGINQSNLLHVSKTSMFDNYLTFLTHEDWPLFSKINSMQRRLLEAGIFQFFREEIEAINSRKNYYVDRDKRRMFTMKELTYGFCFLISLYLISFIIFFGELLLYYCFKVI